MTEADLLFEKLPKAARDAFTRAVEALARSKAGDKAAYAESQKAVTQALEAVGMASAGHVEVYPLASSYDETQRAALQWSALMGLGTWPFACPSYPGTRLRWLGVNPGLLETKQVDGEPLWRALQSNKERMVAILTSSPCTRRSSCSKRSGALAITSTTSATSSKASCACSAS